MTFAKQLTAYTRQLGVSDRRLADAAGVSPGTVSRYKNGRRVPDADHPVVGAVAKGVARLAVERGVSLDEREVLAALRRCLGRETPFEITSANLRALLNIARIKSSALAKGLNFDPSYISRILAGQRHPADPARFAEDVARYIIRHADRHSLAALPGTAPGETEGDAVLLQRIVSFLGSNAEHAAPDPLYGFLSKIDEFDIESYTRGLRFDDVRPPALSLSLPTKKMYEGIAGRKEAELAFCRATALAAADSDVILYSDIPSGEQAKDTEFPEKWMLGMAAMLKKGLRLRIIHNVHRPFEEMMPELERYLPMYMTGQISPYYFREKQEDTFLHLLKVSGAAALTGEAIRGHLAEGRYILSKTRADLRYCRARAEAMLENALPLMQIYRAERKDELSGAIDVLRGRDLRVSYASLPFFTIPERTLTEMLDRQGVTGEKRDEILLFRRKERDAAERFLLKQKLMIEVSRRAARDFEQHPPRLDIAALFPEKEIGYTEWEYAAHLAATEHFAASYGNAALTIAPAPVFHDITYAVSDRAALVSKGSGPAIHFLIRHPKMVAAFRNFIPPVGE